MGAEVANMRIEFHSVEKRFQESSSRAEWWRIEATHHFEAGDTGWTLENVALGGEQREHKIWLPLDTLEWRAAEYEIDPDDRDTLWDVVLAEIYMLPSDMEGEPQLHTHPDLGLVRKAHIARAARVKLRHRIATRTGHQVHDTIKNQSVMHPEALALKKAHVLQVRGSHFGNEARRLGALAARQANPEEHRLAELRKRFRKVIVWPTEETN